MSRRPYSSSDHYSRGPAINERIRVPRVRLMDQHKQMLGVKETFEALRMAREAGLDLVMISPDSDPPVCQILDYGKWKYEQAKKEKSSKAKNKVSELKEVRLGRSMKIDPHDVEIRVRQARGFLMEGHKVQIVQNFRGRELMHKHLGDQRMKQIIETLSDVAKVEAPPRLMGRRQSMILSPDKAKVDAIKRREASSKPPAASESSAAKEPKVKPAEPAVAAGAASE